MRKFLMVLVVSALSLSCARSESSLFEDLPYDAVIVKINGKEHTKRDILRDAVSHMMLAMNKSGSPKISQRERYIVLLDCLKAPETRIGVAEVSSFVATNRISVTPVQEAAARESFEKRWGRRVKKLKRGQNLDELKKVLGDKADFADTMIASTARYMAATNFIFTHDPVAVTPEMVSNRLDFIARHNHDADATNALVYAQATNVWRSITAGKMSFAAAATNFTEDTSFAKFGMEWGPFQMNDLADEPAVQAIMPSLKVGDVTPPIESDNGLAILRREADDNPNIYTFSRIFFRLPMYFDVETSQQAEKALRREVTERRIRETFRDERPKLDIAYPSGTNLFHVGTVPFRLKKEDLAL